MPTARCFAGRVNLLPLITLFAAAFFSKTMISNAAKATELAQNLGRPLSVDEVESLDIHVFPDGHGLPAGKGTVAAGKALYGRHCAVCHGNSGEGGSALELTGDRDLLTSPYPDKGINVVWPYAPTLYEYVNRAMPPAQTGIFNADELYSLTGYLLSLNGLLAADAIVDRNTLIELEMLNQSGFINRYKSAK